MMTDAVLVGGRPVPEHFLDALVTAACAVHDTQRAREARIEQRRGGDARRAPRAVNSAAGSIYVVWPVVLSTRGAVTHGLTHSVTHGAAHSP